MMTSVDAQQAIHPFKTLHLPFFTPKQCHWAILLKKKTHLNNVFRNNAMRVGKTPAWEWHMGSGYRARMCSCLWRKSAIWNSLLLGGKEK